MVNIVTTEKPSSVIMNIDTGEVSPQTFVNDSLITLAQDSGMVGTMNEVNQQGFDETIELRDQYGLENEPIYDEAIHQYKEENSYPDETYEEDVNKDESQDPEMDFVEEKPKKKSSKKNYKPAEKRIKELTYDNYMKAQEAEALQRQRDEMAIELKRMRDERDAYMLAMEKKKLDDDIDRVSNLMVKAKETDQTRSYVEGSRIMSELILKSSQAEAALNQIKQKQEEEERDLPARAEYQKLAEEKFYELSDTRELKSEAYSEWLADNSYYNPYDMENYDADLASDVHEIKRTYNKFLKHNKNADFIGTEEYYRDLDSIIKQKLYGDFVPPYSNKGYTRQQEQEMMNDRQREVNWSVDPNYKDAFGSAIPEGHSRVHKTYPGDVNYAKPRQPNYNQNPRSPNVMPVNRAGYHQSHSPQQLPQLTDIERKLALKFQMWDSSGRPLSDREKLIEYASQKQEMINRQGGRR